MHGLSVQPYREALDANRRLFPGPLDGNGRRSLYIRPALMEPPRFLAVFNFPGGKVTQGRRDVTNVPAQALALLNDPFVVQQAERWGKRLAAGPDGSVEARIDSVFVTALGRAPADDERRQLAEAVGRLAALHGVPPDRALSSEAVWRDLAHAVFNLQEFVYIR
jgi:hypothetical protein